MVFSKPAIQELQKEYPHAPDGQDGVGGVGHVLQIRVRVHLDEVRSGSGQVGTRFEALDELVRKMLQFLAFNKMSAINLGFTFLVLNFSFFFKSFDVLRLK